MEETAHKKAGRKSRADIQAEMTQSPEFKAAVAEAVVSHLATLAPQIEAARTQAVTGNDVGALFDRLAMSISELTTQGTGKVRVSPEELQRREKAREKMKHLIIEARAEKKVPTYQLRNKIFLNEQVIEPYFMNRERKMAPTEIDFWGVPNEVMVPMNDTAKAIFEAFRESIGTVKGVQGVANALPGADDIAFTRGGLVVRNGAVNASMRAHNSPEAAGAPVPQMPAYEDAEVHDYQPLRINSDDHKAGYRNENILGTLAQPARVNA
jgi:hypothetical protein